MRKRIKSIWIFPDKVEFDRNNEHGYAGHHAYKRQWYYTPTFERLRKLVIQAMMQKNDLSYSEPFERNGVIFAMVIFNHKDYHDDNR